LTQSTVQNLIGGKSKNPKLCTIFLICYGLDISLSNFFNDNVFRDIEIEDFI